jgi:hypothetical protein
MPVKRVYIVDFIIAESRVVGFEVLRAGVMKRSVIWDIKSGRVLLATSFHACFLQGLLFDPEYGGDMFLRNVY